MPYLNEDLVSSIKYRSAVPISQTTFDDTALLTLAYEELELKLASDLIKVREDFFLTNELKALSIGVPRYSIPARCIGDALKALFILDSGGSKYEPQKIDVSESYKYYGMTGIPKYYALEGNEVTLYPTPNTSGYYIDFRFAAKPARLLATSSCAKITAVVNNSPTASFTVNTDLTASLSVGSKIDFISANSPFKTLAYKAVITQVTSTLIECLLSSVIDESTTIKPAVGDYICPTDYSNIPQIPTAFHAVLAQMTTVRLLESIGDVNKMAAAMKTLEQMREEALILVRNRVESKPDKVRPKKNLLRYL